MSKIQLDGLHYKQHEMDIPDKSIDDKCPWLNIWKQNKQDKVNYAVSEREDRVTDLTTLTRMTGCTGIY